MNEKRPDEDADLDPAARKRVLDRLRGIGVTVVDPDRTYVGEDVSAAPGTVLYPGTHLRGATAVGPKCRIGPDCWIEDTTIEAGCVVRYSVLEGSVVRAGSVIGPYAAIGADCEVDHCVISDTVVEKNSQLRGVSLAYSLVGENALVEGGPRNLNIGDNCEVKI